MTFRVVLVVMLCIGLSSPATAGLKSDLLKLVLKQVTKPPKPRLEPTLSDDAYRAWKRRQQRPVIARRSLTDDPVARAVVDKRVEVLKTSKFSSESIQKSVADLSRNRAVVTNPDLAADVREVTVFLQSLKGKSAVHMLASFPSRADVFEGSLARLIASRLDAARPLSRPPPRVMADLSSGKVTVTGSARVGAVEFKGPTVNIYKVAALGVGISFCLRTDTCQEVLELPLREALKKQREIGERQWSDVVRKAIGELLEREEAQRDGSLVPSGHRTPVE